MAAGRDIGRLLRKLGHGAPYIEQLQAVGQRRRAALADAEAQLRLVEELLPDALDAGLTISEVAALSAVSRPTLARMRRRAERSTDPA
jgi:hypothetical protein